MVVLADVVFLFASSAAGDASPAAVGGWWLVGWLVGWLVVVIRLFRCCFVVF